MIFFYKEYENSILSTLLDYIGAGFQMLSIVLIVYQILEVVQSGGGVAGTILLDFLSVIFLSAILFFGGKGMRAGARKIAQNKPKRK